MAADRVKRPTHFLIWIDRIRAVVVLCWLAPLLIRVAETGTGETWRDVRREMDKLHLERLDGPASEVLQRTEVTPRQASMLEAISLPEPPRIVGITPIPAVANHSRKSVEDWS